MTRTWNAKLSVGIALIDNQLRELFDRGDLLAEALRDGRPAGDLMRLLTYLQQWVGIHFGAEERLMQQHRLPGYREHEAAHREFCVCLAQVKERVRRGGVPAAEAQVVEALFGDWLVGHVRDADLAVGVRLREHEPLRRGL